MAHKQKKRTGRSDLSAITASITGVSIRYVQMVIKGERNNERVLETYMRLKEGKSNLIKAVEKAVQL